MFARLSISFVLLLGGLQPVHAECGFQLGNLFRMSNPLPKSGMKKVSDFKNPEAAMHEYLWRLYWHRKVGFFERFRLSKLLTYTQTLPANENPLTSDPNKTLDEIFVLLAAGKNPHVLNEFENKRRRDSRDRIFRPWMKRTGVATKWAGTIAFTALALYSIYNFVSAYNTGFTETPTLSNRMDSFNLEYWRRWGYRERSELSPIDLERFHKGYYETESSVHHQVQYARNAYLDFQNALATETTALAAAVQLKSEVLKRDSLLSVYTAWRTRPDVLRSPFYGKLCDRRAKNIFKEFDPEGKYWQEFEKTVSEDRDGLAK